VSEVAADERRPGVVFAAESWVRAWRYLAYDPAARRSVETTIQPKGPFDDPADLEAREVLVRSGDGTMVPLSIVARRGRPRDGSAPALVTGYGAYGISIEPFFVPGMLAWLERGGVFATAHVRGGGEYGREWYAAGRRATKPNTWRDFIATAQYLVDGGYTAPARLAAWGASAGGILAGRAITERPDLFRAAILDVGVLDMVRFETMAGGAGNVPEYGSVRTPEGFRALLAMSAYHHVRDGAAYPAVLLTHGTNDPRVAPWQSAKAAARLQAATSSGRPVLLRLDTDAGHGFGSTNRQLIEELADKLAFVLWQTGAPDFQPPGGAPASAPAPAAPRGGPDAGKH
jgi:prolyl oligopeptidase